MSSDDGIEYHKSLQHHHHQHQSSSVQHSSSHIQPLSLPSTSTSSGCLSSSNTNTNTNNGNNNGNSSTSSSINHQQQSTQPSQQISLGTSTITRRKSSLSYQHQLQQASSEVTSSSSSHTVDSIGGSGGNLSSNSANTSSTSGIGNSSSASSKNALNNSVSPNRYSVHQPEGYHHIGGHLSIHPIDRFDDAMTCCLPPPSPAPTSDRFVMGLPPTSSLTAVSSSHHYADQSTQSSSAASSSHSKYTSGSSSLHRTMSPNSRFRMSDRYRDVSPKCDRFVTTTHFLVNSTPSVSSDTYAYLSSTVHTPVKRYVPTPPPPTEIYSDIPQSSSSTSSSSGYHTIGNSQHQLSSQQQSHQNPNVNTLPYRFRMKCCLTEQSVSSTISTGQVSHHDRSTVADHYATPPRVRPFKCPSNNGQNSIACSSGVSTQSVQQQQQQQQVSNPLLVPQNIRHSEYMPRTPSIEYLGSASGRVMTPVNVMSETSGNTCLHCNTIRRTTGVHQTTQTTGPISPIPQQQNLTLSTTVLAGVGHPQIDGINDINSNSPTPSANHSQASLMSPSVQQQDQQKNEQISCGNHHQSQSQQQQQQSSQTSQSSLANRAYQQQSQHQSQHQHNHTQPSLQSMPHSTSNRHHHNIISSNNNASGNNNGNMFCALPIRQQMQQRLSRKQRLKEYIRREVAKFFGVDAQSEEEERIKWNERQKLLALRRFGQLKIDNDFTNRNRNQQPQQPPGDRPDILPAQTTDESQINHYDGESHLRIPIEKKASVPTMIFSGMSYIIQTINKRQQRTHKQWSRSFAPAHVSSINGDNPGDMCEGLSALQEEEVFFDSPSNDLNSSNGNGNNANNNSSGGSHVMCSSGGNVIEHPRQIYMGERIHGWRTSASLEQHQVQQHCGVNGVSNGMHQRMGYRGKRISSQLLDGVLDNSRRPIARKVKLLRINEFDDRNDHRPFFTYWINTVQILVLTLSLICYGIGPVGIGMEQKSGQVLVTSLSLQTVQHQEQRNVWIGPRTNDLVHLGAKFAPCMRRDSKIMDVISKTRRQERETACCIRNDDSGCVQSSQADCSVRGLWPTKSISTWKKWSPGESGPGGRISGSVCGLDPKYCDAPASIAPYEWPDDITKWPICRKTNSFSQRFRFKDHTAEHMVCEVIGHPCCTGVIGECRITTREYCDFINGYFHEEASLCSQVSCLNNVCGMFPFLSPEVPDQFYRLFTSLCLHAGILHLAITVAFQHIFLADLERLIGPIRTAIVYIGSGLAGNLTSAILVPYKPEVGPLASLGGVVSSLVVLLLLIHWKQLKKPHLALIKLIVITGTLFGMGTLPWQQNFAGLMAGIFCGILLTIALVPFVSVSKYGRKTKINLIWTCMLFYLFMYTIMFVIFYLFPTEFMSLGFRNVLNNGMDSDGIDSTIIEGGHSLNNINHHHQQSSQHHQNHHHHSDDIVINSSTSDRRGNGIGSIGSSGIRSISSSTAIESGRLINRAVRMSDNDRRSNDANNRVNMAYSLKYDSVEQQSKQLHNVNHQQQEYLHHRVHTLITDSSSNGIIDNTDERIRDQSGNGINNSNHNSEGGGVNGNEDGGVSNIDGVISNNNGDSIVTCDKNTCITTTNSANNNNNNNINNINNNNNKNNKNNNNNNNNNINNNKALSNRIISGSETRINVLSDDDGIRNDMNDRFGGSNHGSGSNDIRINNNNNNINNNNINIINNNNNNNIIMNNNDNEDVISEGVLSVSNAINQRIITA